MQRGQSNKNDDEHATVYDQIIYLPTRKKAYTVIWKKK